MSTELEAMRLPPCNVEAEEAIIGGLMISPIKMEKISPVLNPFDFYLPGHQVIFSAMLELYQQNLPTSYTYLVDTLKRTGKLERAGGLNRLHQITNNVFHAVNIGELVDLVKEKSLRRSLITLANKINELAHESPTATEAIDTAQAELFAMRSQFADNQQKIERFGDILPQVIAEIEESNSGEEAVSLSVPTGLIDFDNATNGGLQIGTLTIFAGRAAMGKTTSALEVGLYAARCGLPVACFSMEMTKEQILKKLLARMAGVPVSQMFQRNAMNKRDMENLYNIRDSESDSNLSFWIQDKSSLTIDDIRSDLRTLQTQFGGVGLVIVDHIGLMAGTRESKGNRVRELDQILSGLRMMAKDFQSPVLGLAQISRGVEGRAEKRPTLTDIRESGGFENEGALVVGLYRDEYYNPDTTDRGIFEFIVMKNRFGPTGTIKTLFEPDYGRFKNLKQ